MSVRSGSTEPALSGQRPSGTVAFAFTDIERSTERWERDRTAMQEAVRRHDAIVQAAIASERGYVFKALGDGFCAAFSRPEDAVSAMIAVQHAVAAEDFSSVGGIAVRAAIHTGTADERNGDYFGPAVNRVARLLAIGHGGQVLVSGTTADLLEGALPPHVGLRDLGQHRLKDLARAEHVYQLVAPQLRDAFPAPRSLDALPNNLPRQVTSFVGRDAVIAEVTALLERSALVTLVGPGGAGKTRCAVQAGAELLDAAEDGVWLVELAPISDPLLVASVVAKALNVHERSDATALDAVVAYLKRRRLLLILDNCEHVIHEARTVASAILGMCPNVRLLVTSRERLNIAGEQVYRVPSLTVPATTTVTAASAAQYGAVALFADRAYSVEKQFALTDANAPYVVEICRRLDGIPLAIELAAARLNILSPQQLAAKLDERFRLLTGGDRSALPRQQTMRALIDWSFDLLADEERTLFRRLAIFAGGFSLETAVAVCAGDALDDIAVLDVLASLVAKSLVQADVSGSGTRYRLLESTRQYAREKLVECGELAAVARRHGLAFLAVGDELERTWYSTPAHEWVARAEADLENWRAALEWALDARNDVLLGQRLAACARIPFVRLLAEGRRWVHAAQQTVGDETPLPVAAKLDLCEAFFDWRFAQHKASFVAAERAVSRFRKLGDLVQMAQVLRIAGNALVVTGRIGEGEAMLEEALGIARPLGFRKFTGWVLEALASARCLKDDLPGARAIFAETIAIAEETAHWQLAATSSISLAEAEFRGGDPATALRLAREARAAYRAGNDVANVATTQANIAAYLIALRRYDEALVEARDAFAPLRDAQHEVVFTFTLQHVAAIAALRNAPDEDRGRADRARAAGLIGYVDAHLAALEAVRESTEQQEYDAVIPVLRNGLGSAAFDRAVAEGRAWLEDQALAQAMLV